MALDFDKFDLIELDVEEGKTLYPLITKDTIRLLGKRFGKSPLEMHEEMTTIMQETFCPDVKKPSNTIAGAYFAQLIIMMKKHEVSYHDIMEFVQAGGLALEDDEPN